jgi:GNAT superfamily N-acetyltransferase
MLDGDPVGTVALLHDGEGTRELAKMAVTARAQGRGIGRRLLQAAIDHARQRGVHTIYLETNDRLAAACHLYTALGFFEIPDRHPGDPRYARCTTHMALEL